MRSDETRAEPAGSERESLQVIELMLRPGQGQCGDPTVAHAVVVSMLGKHGIEALDEL